MGQGAGSDNSFIVAGVRYDQSAIKTRASTAIKSILQQHFKFTGQETIQPTMDKVETDSNGRWHVRFKQYFDGLPIEGASLLAHIDPVSGMLIGINGEFHSGSSMDPVFRSASNRLSCESAAEIALAEYGAPEGEWQSACTVAIVQGRDGKARRAFKRLFGYQPAGAGDPYQLDQVFADRVSGSLLTVHPQVMGARAINTFDCRRREVGPNDCKLVTSIPEKISYPDKINSRKRAAEDAHNSAVDVYDFFMNYFGRDSYDGKGATIRSYTNYGALFNNAFFSVAFDGIVYGNGDGTCSNQPAFGNIPAASYRQVLLLIIVMQRSITTISASLSMSLCMNVS
jgi:Zn-dependent metalloprotease